MYTLSASHPFHSLIVKRVGEKAPERGLLLLEMVGWGSCSPILSQGARKDEAPTDLWRIEESATRPQRVRVRGAWSRMSRELAPTWTSKAPGLATQSFFSGLQ